MSAGASMRLDEGRSYHVITASFDEDGNLMEPEGVISDYDTGCPFATFAIIKPAIPNTRVEASPYGQSVFADAIDTVQSVDLAFDALVNEVDVSKMRIFLSDVMFDHDKSSGKNTPIPFGKGNCTIFRKVTAGNRAYEKGSEMQSRSPWVIINSCVYRPKPCKRW